MLRYYRLLLLVLFAHFIIFLSSPVQAQLTPRLGFGFNGMLHTADGFALGLRGRVSAPVNADLSFALDMGINGYVFSGHDDATWIFDPQLSAIVTLPSVNTMAYLMGGFGAYIPVANKEESKGGPSVNLGIGWVRPLNETSLFYEVNPAIIIGKNKVHFALPVRVGFIF